MKKLITFDFDSTLTKTRFDASQGIFLPSMDPKEQMLDLLRVMALAFDVKIVSSRWATDKSEIIEFVKEHNLPISEIICTDGSPKWITLRQINSIMHFDDDEIEIDSLEEKGLKGFLS